MKISKTICAAAVALLLVLQNFAPMVPVIADTVETGETKATVETEAPKETKKSTESAKPKETKCLNPISLIILMLQTSLKE